MIATAALAVVLLTAAQAAAPSPDTAGAAIATSLATCERWLLDPASWSADVSAFGQGEGLQPEVNVPDIALPPPSMRTALHHWRVPLGEGGVYVTTSEHVPLCHLSGGGPFDLQPAIARTLASAGFKTRWKRIDTRRRGEMASTRYVSTDDPALTMTISHAAAAGARTDRVQFLATAQYQTGK